MINVPNTRAVDPTNKCDVCKDKLAPFYNITYFIHVCSTTCWNKFLEGYNREIDEIALKIENADDLGDSNEK